MFIKAENKEIFQEIQELKKLIMSEVEKIEKEVSSSKIKSTIIKFTNAISILEVYIYIISLNELHKSESEFSKLELLTQLKESAELV